MATIQSFHSYKQNPFQICCADGIFVFRIMNCCVVYTILCIKLLRNF